MADDAPPPLPPLGPSGDVDWDPEAHGWEERLYGDYRYSKRVGAHVWSVFLWHHGWWVEKDRVYLGVPTFETPGGSNNLAKLCWEIDHGLGMARS